MADKPYLVPGPDHPIAIERADARVIVRVDREVIADSTDAFVLREANYPPVYYLPRGDADMRRLVRTDHTTHCPYKGDASYFSITTDGGARANAVWSYEAPHAAVAAIRDRLAFYPDRVDDIEVQPA